MYIFPNCSPLWALLSKKKKYNIDQSGNRVEGPRHDDFARNADWEKILRKENYEELI